MKILSDNIRLLLLLVLWSIDVTSCSEAMEEVGNAEVTFMAILRGDAQTRVFGDGLKVNTLAVGIFNEQLQEIERKEFPITASTIKIQLSLVKNQTYNFVFWAYNRDSGIYDIEENGSLTAIRMERQQFTTFAQAENADAFFATVTNFEIRSHTMLDIDLVRPLAQINVGTLGSAARSSFTVAAAPRLFHPFTATVSEENDDFIWDFAETTTETFSLEDTDTPFAYLALAYVFAPNATVMKKDCQLTLKDATGQAIKTTPFSKIVLQANRRSNIVGNLTDPATK